MSLNNSVYEIVCFPDDGKINKRNVVVAKKVLYTL